MLQFDDRTHTYTMDGRIIPSVTGILKATGFIDTRFYTRQGRDRGSSVHELLEYADLFGEGPEEAPEEFRGYLMAWAAFKRESGFNPEEVERPVYWRFPSGHEYAGMLDRAGPLNKRRAVLDIKTGSPADWHILQAAAYGTADAQGAAIGAVYLRDSGRYSLKVFDAADSMNAKIMWEAIVRKFYEQRAGHEVHE